MAARGPGSRSDTEVLRVYEPFGTLGIATPAKDLKA
jgi:hypothetical protein